MTEPTITRRWPSVNLMPPGFEMARKVAMRKFLEERMRKMEQFYFDEVMLRMLFRRFPRVPFLHTKVLRGEDVSLEIQWRFAGPVSWCRAFLILWRGRDRRPQ